MKTLKNAKLYVEAAFKLIGAVMLHPNTDHVVRFYEDHIEVAPQNHGPIALGMGKGSHS